MNNLKNDGRTFHGGGGGSSIVKVPGDVPPAKGYAFSNLLV